MYQKVKLSFLILYKSGPNVHLLKINSMASNKISYGAITTENQINLIRNTQMHRGQEEDSCCCYVFCCKQNAGMEVGITSALLEGTNGPIGGEGGDSSCGGGRNFDGASCDKLDEFLIDVVTVLLTPNQHFF
ncbi:unnamed protein product [Allacma fusca]|uniref:Uncharacterized protein n=1 Tax=Allacma fusca TaxID=39272 RepID=A0A8J2NHE2_9HEXA|nr:unnamed protein product [Allacma fusca]